MAYELAKQFLREAGVEECVDALLLEELQKVLSGESPYPLRITRGSS